MKLLRRKEVHTVVLSPIEDKTRKAVDSVKANISQLQQLAQRIVTGDTTSPIKTGDEEIDIRSPGISVHYKDNTPKMVFTFHEVAQESETSEKRLRLYPPKGTPGTVTLTGRSIVNCRNRYLKDPSVRRSLSFSCLLLAEATTATPASPSSPATATSSTTTALPRRIAKDSSQTTATPASPSSPATATSSTTTALPGRIAKDSSQTTATPASPSSSATATSSTTTALPKGLAKSHSTEGTGAAAVKPKKEHVPV